MDATATISVNTTSFLSIQNYRQLENLVDGLIAIGDEDGDRRITFAEYVRMANDVFVDNFAPDSIKRILRND